MLWPLFRRPRIRSGDKIESVLYRAEACKNVLGYATAHGRLPDALPWHAIPPRKPSGECTETVWSIPLPAKQLCLGRAPMFWGKE